MKKRMSSLTGTKSGGKAINLLMLIGLAALAGCTPAKGSRLTTKPEKGAVPVTIEVTAGETWMHKQKMGAFTLKIIPQFALWIEDENGNYVDTLFVTRAFGKQAWQFVKVDPDVTLRDKSLPFWMNRRAGAGFPSPTKNNPVADAISGATPKSTFTLATAVPQGLRRFTVYLEVNKSFDGNESYFGAWDGTDEGFSEEVINGQPSVIWAAFVDLDDPARSADFVLLGHGGLEGGVGAPYDDVSGLTTAVRLIGPSRVLY